MSSLIRPIRHGLPLPVAAAATLVATVAATLAAPGGAMAHPYRLDPTHTGVHWEVLHMGTSTSRGRFDTLTGRAAYEPGRLLEVDITVQTASVSTGIPVFDRVLRGSSLLAVEAHPQARFVSDGVRWAADGVSPQEISGQLTLKGQTRPLVLRMARWRCGNNPLFGREVCGGDFQASLSRSGFGLGFAGAMAEDTVQLRVQVEAVRTEAQDEPAGAAR